MSKLQWMLLFLMIALAGCGVSNQAQVESTGSVKEPAVQDKQYAQDMLVSAPMRGLNAQSCVHPAGWQAYQVKEGELAEGIAARAGTTLENLLSGNCFTYPQQIMPGLVIYVPVQAQVTSPNTVLPLGISMFVVDPVMAEPGQTVRVYWQGQGPVQTVRIGWVFSGYFVEELRSLPQSGIVELTVPDDGRGQITYMIRVGDGVQPEISAETTIRVACRESWFFSPAPAECGSAPLVTDFVEQHFERGTIVFFPALGVHYVMVAGQEAVLLDDDFVPGMPNQNIDVPAGYSPTQGPINTVWNKDGVRAALGNAVSEAVTYPGMLQRSVDASGEVIYFSASSGHVYRVGTGIVWGVIIPE